MSIFALARAGKGSCVALLCFASMAYMPIKGARGETQCVRQYMRIDESLPVIHSPGKPKPVPDGFVEHDPDAASTKI